MKLSYKNISAKKHIRIGQRIIKSAIATGLAYWISQLLNTHSPVYAVIAVIITMQPTVHETLTTSKTRLLGTIAGIVIGLVYALLIPINAFTLGLGILIVLSICTNMGWTAGCTISCFAFASMTVKADATIVDGFYRFVDTGIGIGASLLVNFLYPNKSFNQTIDNDLISLKEKLLAYINLNLQYYITSEQGEQLGKLTKLKEEIQCSLEVVKTKCSKFERECKYRHFSEERAEYYNYRYDKLWSIFILTGQISLDVTNSHGVHSNVKHLFLQCFQQLSNLQIISLRHKNDIVVKQLNIVDETIQEILLDIEKIGIDEYCLSRNEKREVTNILYTLHNILNLLGDLT